MTMTLNEDRLMAFVGKAIGDFGALVNGALVVVGDRLGFYRAMADGQPTTLGGARRAHRDDRAVRPRVAERADRQRLRHVRGRRPLQPARGARARADRREQPGLRHRRVPAGARLGPIGRPADRGVPHWRRDRLGRAPRGPLPRVRAVVRPVLPHVPREHLDPGARRGRRRSCEAGGSVADVGCGFGTSTIVMAEAFPAATFVGFDPHSGSVEAARDRAAAAGLGDRVRFEVGDRAELPGHVRPRRLLRLRCTTWATRREPRRGRARR